MLLFPLAALGRGFSADAVLLHLTGSVLNLTSNQQAPLPPTGTVLALAWATLGTLLVTLAGAWQRQRWFWLTGLLTFGLATAAVIVLGGALDDQTKRVLADTTLRPGAKRQLGNFYASGGMNLGLFLPALAGLIAAGAGLSARAWWWQTFNRMRSLLVPAAAIGLAVLVGAVVVLIEIGRAHV